MNRLPAEDSHEISNINIIISVDVLKIINKNDTNLLSDVFHSHGNWQFENYIGRYSKQSMDKFFL